MSKAPAFILILLGVVLIAATQSVFIVTERHQSMVIQFGEPVAQYTAPGLKFKVPLIQQVMTFEKRALDVDAMPEQVILSDKKRIVVDTFARYRIIDMLKFYQSLQTVEQANNRLGNIINSTMRSALGNASLIDILSDKRGNLMVNIRKQVNETVKANYGVEVIDVRISRADLPDETSQSIYARMRTEREREAAEFRAQGQEAAQEIKSKADREVTVLLAAAGKEAQILRGQGDEQAIKIYADAFKKDPEFYAFYRTMEAYKSSLSGDNTTFILSPNSDFLKFFENEDGRKK